MKDLIRKRCVPCKGNVVPYREDKVRELCLQVPGWVYREGQIEKTFVFKNFYETIAFANAVAWIANTEDHHPELHLSYKKCVIQYCTHSISGISENDFICAAKINHLIVDD